MRTGLNFADDLSVTSIDNLLVTCWQPRNLCSDVILTLYSPQAISATSKYMKLVHWLLTVGCYIWYGEEGTGRGRSRGIKIHDFRPISRFISEMIQERVITNEPQQELVCALSNGAISNDLE